MQAALKWSRAQQWICQQLFSLMIEKVYRAILSVSIGSEDQPVCLTITLSAFGWSSESIQTEDGILSKHEAWAWAQKEVYMLRWCCGA